MATGSKLPHELMDGDVFYHQTSSTWFEVDFIAIGRPSTSWVTVHTVKKGSQDPTVLMLPANDRVLILIQSQNQVRRRQARRRSGIQNRLNRRY